MSRAAAAFDVLRSLPDEKLTCWEMKRYPDLIFNDNVDLWAGSVPEIHIGSLEELKSVLDSNPGEGDVRTALNIALLLQRPPAHIALLVKE